MPPQKGQFTLSDVEQSSGQAGQFTAADIDGLTPQQRMILARNASPTQFEIERDPRFQAGFGGNEAEAAKNLAKGVALNVAGGAPYQAYQGYQKARQEYESLRDTGKLAEQRQNEERKAAGYDPFYRHISAPAAESIGVPVQQMEHAADVGDVGGVIGAATPITAASLAPLAAEGVARGVPVAGEGLRSAVPYAVPVAKAAAKTAAKTADVATLHAASKIYEIWRSVPAEIRARAEANTPVYPGAPYPENPGIYPGAPLPAAPEAALLQGNALTTRPVANAPGAPASALADVPAPSIYPGAPLPERPSWIGSPSAAAVQSVAPKATMTQLASESVKAAGGHPELPVKPVAGRPIYQRSPSVAAAPKFAELPPLVKVESSVVEGYHYDPSGQVLTLKTKGGAAYRYGEVTPEEANNFAQADSYGKAYRTIRNNHVLLEANYGNGWVSKANRSMSSDAARADYELTRALEESLKQAKGKKAD